ncbi:hypothetical protein [Burkholderia stagnalis]|uniref:hypothetical protein n=1 Tax=Burkholderia stagnalis TaxID=1503054 RepID=UPI0012DAC62B|nr:hypothetical protein [Burkholderia stagnalis]
MRSLRCIAVVPIAAVAQPPQSPQSPQAQAQPQPQSQSQSLSLSLSQSLSQPQSQSQSQSRRLLRASCLSRSRHAQDSPQSPRLFHLSNLPHLSSAQFCQLGSAAHGDYTLCAR